MLDDTDAPDMRYVALLIEGRALERRGAHAEAAKRYLEACDADPRGSVALLAASHALKATGRREEARERLLRALQASGPGEYLDPWQSYYQGRPAWLVQSVASLQRARTAR
jgi:tetratricopeptide (TPR) repeat protein